MQLARPATAFVFGRLHGAPKPISPNRLGRRNGRPGTCCSAQQQSFVFIAELGAGSTVKRFDYSERDAPEAERHCQHRGRAHPQLTQAEAARAIKQLDPLGSSRGAHALRN